MHEVSPSTGQQRGSRPSLHLLYHELRPGKAEYSYVVPTSAFAEHLDLFQHVRQSEAASLWPEITFDDGHVSNYEQALPLLQARGMEARFFITAGWTGQKPGYMGWSELRALHDAGQILGAHGWSHALLTHCTPKDLHFELTHTRTVMEDKLGAPITSISLPGGRSNRHVLLACQEAGYTEIFTSVPKSEPVAHGLEVGRLNIRGDMKLAWIASLLEPGSPTLAGLERQDRIKSAAKSLLGDTLYAKLWRLINREESNHEAHAK